GGGGGGGRAGGGRGCVGACRGAHGRHHTPRRSLEEREHAEEGRLAGAVGADHGQDLAGGDGERGDLEGDLAPVADHDVLEGAHGGRSLHSGRGGAPRTARWLTWSPCAGAARP